MKITELLYERLISHIRNFSNSKMKVGVELEYPIVHKQAKNIEKNIIENLFKELLKAGFKPLYSSKSQLIGAEKQNEIVITLDTSYNNLELAFAPQPSLLNIEKSLTYYLQIIRNYLQANGYSLIDKGLNPDFATINSTLIDDEEIKAECNFLECFAPPNFHGHTDLFAFISSSQTHLEISLDKIPLALNAFSKLDFIETLLFANSKLDTPEGLYYSGRHYIYSRSAFQKANLVGSIDEIVETIDDIVELYAKKCLFLRYRDKWEFIKPISLKEYFGENVHQAKAEDLNSFYSYCNTELKVYGTLERRGACSQAFDNALAPSAFNLGLGIMIEAVEELLNKFFHDNKIIFSNNELCELSAKRNLDWIQHKKLNGLISAVLMMAEAGLKQRGYGEEKYLKNVGRFF